MESGVKIMRRKGIFIMMNLIGLIKPLMFYMILAIVLGVLGFLTAIGVTVIGGYGLVSALGYVDISAKTVFIAIILCAVLRGVLHYGEQACNHYIAFKLLALIRRKVFDALRRLTPAKLEGKRKGDLISIITTDIELLEVFYAHTISPIAIAILTSIVILVVLAQYHIVFSLVALVGYLFVGLILPLILGERGSKAGMKYREDFASLNSTVFDSLRGIDELLQYGHGKEYYKNIEVSQEELNKSAKKLRSVEGIQRGITVSAILVFTMIMLLTAIALYDKYEVNFDGVLMGMLIMLSSFGPVVALSNLSNNLSQTLASGERVLRILEEEPVVNEVVGNDSTEFGNIKVKDLSFAYDRTNILKDMNLDIEKGSVVGILGKSGSGKSTLLKLLMRFWQVEKGEITISEKSIDAINTDELRDMQGYVTQETWLFNDTIRNNIAISKLDATDEEIVEASKKAGINNFIMSLPKGYDTSVGELGDSLSGGERQRIGLARAFLHDAPMMLLDEPTSNLDSLHESYILDSLSKSRGEKTVVLVSHRESTMALAKKVYKVENGRMS